MKKLNLIEYTAICLLISIVVSCNQHSVSKFKNKPTVLKFNRHKLMDKQGTGLVAATYLVPEGWKVQDRIVWNINNVALPATVDLYILDKESGAAMQGFPNLAFFVNTTEEMNEEYPAGSHYLGVEVISQKPEVLDLIKNYVIPEFRNISGLKIIESKKLSIFQSNHQRAKEFKNTNSQSGVIRVEYTENGKEYEEAIYGTITVIPVSQYQVLTYLSMCYGCKAEKGNLNGIMGIFETILNSVKMNPKWAVTYNMVMQLAMQNAMGNHGNDTGEFDNNGEYGYNEGGNGNNGNYTGDNGEDYGSNYPGGGDGNYNGGNYNAGNYSGSNSGMLSNYLRQANGQIDDMIIQRYENQQRSEDRTFEGYSDYIRDYQNYTDPNTGDVYKLSAGYNNAWTDNNGSVVMSNDAGYDPNVGGTSSWSALDTGGSTVAPASTSTESE